MGLVHGPTGRPVRHLLGDIFGEGSSLDESVVVLAFRELPFDLNLPAGHEICEEAEGTTVQSDRDAGRKEKGTGGPRIGAKGLTRFTVPLKEIFVMQSPNETKTVKDAHGGAQSWRAASGGQAGFQATTRARGSPGGGTRVVVVDAGCRDASCCHGPQLC